MDQVRVSGLFIYPVKSARGVAVDEAEVGDRGLVHDRRFMVVDERGGFLTQRQHPALALIQATLHGDTLVLSAPDAGHAEVPLRPRGGEHRRVRVWGDTCEALSVGLDAADLLRRYLDVRCELVYMPDESIRPVDPDFAEPGDHVSFADGFPLLLTSQASLDDLNGRLAARGLRHVPMERFRPNLVVEGAGAYAEDCWDELAVGAVTFRVAKPCARCSVVTVDQRTGVEGKEPLATLATYRREARGVTFGQNLVHRTRGVIRVGDRVRPVNMP